MGADPQLIHDQPDKISVWFLGERRIIDRDWYDHVTTLARMPQQHVKAYLEERRNGK